MVNKPKINQGVQEIDVHQNTFYNVEEAAKYLSLSKSSIYKMTSNSKITYFKPNGGKAYFRKSDLDLWLLKNPCKSIEVLEEEMNKKIGRL